MKNVDRIVYANIIKASKLLLDAMMISRDVEYFEFNKKQYDTIVRAADGIDGYGEYFVHYFDKKNIVK